MLKQTKRQFKKVRCGVCKELVSVIWLNRHMAKHNEAVTSVSILPGEVTTVGDSMQSVKEIDEAIVELHRQVVVLREARELLKRT